jgi:hypothetical protein
MTKRRSAAAAPAPLEAYAQHFDELFERRHQREAFRRSREGLVLPAERTKTLTAWANAVPITGAQHAAVQSLPWFLSESTWDAAASRRLRRCGYGVDAMSRAPLARANTSGGISRPASA